jgi:hypothetical protein
LREYTPDEKTKQRIDNDFSYHPPKEGQEERYITVRHEFRMMAHWLTRMCPPSRELAVSLTHLEEAMIYANAAIARNE